MKKVSKRRTFKHLTQSDRDRIEIMRKQGILQKDIAEVLGVNPGTICRELKRKKRDGSYEATTAGHKVGVKRSHSNHQGMKIQKNDDLRKRYDIELANSCHTFRSGAVEVLLFLTHNKKSLRNNLVTVAILPLGSALSEGSH